MPATPDPLRPTAWRVLLLLAGLVALAYWPLLHCGFVWDDDDYVTQNPVLRSAAGIVRIWFEPTSLPQYYPLVHSTFWAEYRAWGPSPLGYHLVNALLHLGSSYVLWTLLRRLALPGALLAAALFAVHPVEVESVAWVTERKNTLSLLCMLLAARQWLAWRDGGKSPAFWFATAWFLCALLSKTVTATLPAALLVVQWWRHGRIARRDVTSLLPWFALAIGLGAVTAWLEATHVRASGTPWQLSGLQRLLVAGRAPWFYLGTLLWPFGLCFNYPRWKLDPTDPLQWLPVAATALAVILALALRRRIGRGPAAGLLLFGGMLVPALGFFDVYPFRFSYVADHFQYHASAAMLAVLGVGASRLQSARLPARGAVAMAAAVLVGLAILASRYTGDYRDLETSWRSVLDRNPESMLALTNLGGILLMRDDLEGARRCFDRCLELYPDNHETLANLGQIAHRTHDLTTARRYYERALAISPDNAAALRNLAELDRDEGHPELALPHVQRAVALDPDFYDAHRTLAAVQLALGHHAEALAAADWVLQRTPAAADMRLIAAQGLLALGRDEPAAQNAAAILAQLPAMVQAQDVFATAFARLLQRTPAEGIATRVAHALQSGRLDAGILVPKITAALRQLGAGAHAAALSH